MKKFINLSALVAGIGIGYIGKDMTTALASNEHYISVEIPSIDNSHEIEVVVPSIQQPILVKPFALPMLTPVNAKQDPPSDQDVDWGSELLSGVKFFEGYRAKAYTCSGGVRTIGYGCTDGSILAKGVITKERATAVLKKELKKVEQHVNNIVDVKLNKHQLAALTSFTFNCGLSNLKKLVNGSGRLNDGNYESISKLLPQYRIAGGKVRKGLVKRRAWEVSLWRGTVLELN